jgi:RNA polymerase sigma-70 factor, ECF subfamily
VPEAASLTLVGTRPAEDGALLDALARRAATGDRDAFSELYTLLVDDLYRYVRGQIHDDGQAEDIVAEAFLRAWRFIPRYRSGSNSLRPWIFAIARNQVRDAWRQEHHRPTTLQEDVAEEPEEAEPDEQETAQTLRRALRALTDDQRDVVLLRYFGGKSHSEIARLVGKREGAIRATLVRALRRMRREIDDVAV